MLRSATRGRGSRRNRVVVGRFSKGRAAASTLGATRVCGEAATRVGSVILSAGLVCAQWPISALRTRCGLASSGATTQSVEDVHTSVRGSGCRGEGTRDRASGSSAQAVAKVPVARRDRHLCRLCHRARDRLDSGSRHGRAEAPRRAFAHGELRPLAWTPRRSRPRHRDRQRARRTRQEVIRRDCATRL